MAQEYIVSYKIDVLSKTATERLTAFAAEASKLAGLSAELDKIAASIKKINNAFSTFNGKKTLTINTGNATRSLEALEAKITKIKKEANTPINMSVNGNVKGGGSSNQQSSKTTTTTTITNTGGGNTSSGGGGNTTKGRVTSYKVFGQSLLDTGGIGAVNMLKGFGIAYGITGLIGAINGVLKQSVDYDNLAKTTYNLLKTHDSKPNFEGRYAEMNRTLRNVGVETKFTAPQVADAGRFLAMAGMNIDEINKSIRPISDLALIGDTDLGATADVVTNIMTGYSLKASQVKKASDILTMSATSANTTIMEMAESFKYSASLLSNSGVSFEEASAAIGVLGNAGIKGSQAGTTLRTLMVNLLRPTTKQSKMWNALGVQRYDSNGNLRDLTEIFGDLHKAGATTPELATMFHKTALQGAISLMNNVSKWNEIIGNNLLSDNIAQKLANEKKNTIYGLWMQLTSSFTEQGIKRFEAMTTRIKKFLNDAIVWFKSSDAAKLLKDFVDAIIEVSKGLLSVVRTHIFIFNTFKPLILTYIKLQALAAPFLIGGRVLTALMNLFTWLKGMQAIQFTGLFGGFLGGKAAASTMTAVEGGVVAGAGVSLFSKAGIKSLFSGGGKAILGNLAGLLGTVAPYLLLGYAGYSIIQSAIDKTNEAAKSIQNWGGEIVKINGLNIDKHASKMVAYMDMMSDKQGTVNQKIETYILRLKEEYGIMAGLSKSAGEKMGDVDREGLSKDNSIGGMDMLFQGNAMKKLLAVFKGLTPEQQMQKYYVTADQIKNPKWLHDNITGPNPFRKIQMLQAYLYSMAQANSGAQFQGKKEQWMADINNLTGSQSLLNYYNTTQQESKKIKYRNKIYQNLDELRNSPVSEFEQSKMYALQLGQNLWNYKYTSGGFGHDAMTAYVGAWKSLEKYGSVSSDVIQKLLYYNGIGVLNPATSGRFLSKQWLAAYGLNEKGDYVGGGTYAKSIEDAKSTITSIVLEIQKAAQNMNSAFTPFVNQLLSSPLLSKIMLSGTKGGDELAMGSAKEPSNGVKADMGSGFGYYVYDAKTNKYVLRNDLDPDNKANNPAKSLSVGGDIFGGLGGDKTTNPYSSSYKSGMEAPKQIIVRINNLMNVDKVDLSDNKKKEVVEKLRSELAQTLIDVVADFDASMNV